MTTQHGATAPRPSRAGTHTLGSGRRSIASLVLLTGAIMCSAAPVRAADEELGALGQLAGQAVRYQFQKTPQGFPATHARTLDIIAKRALLPEFEPPHDAPRRVHFGDKTTCDAMCVDYEVGGLPVRFVLLFGVAVVSVDVGRREVASPDVALQLVREVVLRAFENAARLHLTAEALPDGTFRGRQVTHWASDDDWWHNADWLDSLCWWYDGTQLRLGFSLWRAGSNHIVSPTFKDNHYWFRYVKPGAPLPEGAPTGPPEGQ